MDAEHSAGNVSTIRMHPVLDGIVGAAIPNHQTNGIVKLKESIEKMLK